MLERFPTNNDAVLKESREGMKQTAEVLDEAGQTLCRVDYDPKTGEILTVKPERYTNVEETAEHLEEKIYVTDDQGNITNERLTREEARSEQKRYLIVSSLLFSKDGRMLVQKRSIDKKIDPGKKSISAHGVAKELFSEHRARITEGKIAALINTALEINEELRHDAAPFTVKIWHGTHDDLFRHAKDLNIDDPNTVWLVPESYLPDGGYPLGSWGKGEARTRAFSSGFIFCEGDPLISIDPSELESAEWRQISEALQDSGSAVDLPRSAEKVLRDVLKESTLEKKYGPKFTDDLVGSWFGEDIYSDKP